MRLTEASSSSLRPVSQFHPNESAGFAPLVCSALWGMASLHPLVMKQRSSPDGNIFYLLQSSKQRQRSRGGLGASCSVPSPPALGARVQPRRSAVRDLHCARCAPRQTAAPAGAVRWPVCNQSPDRGGRHRHWRGGKGKLTGSNCSTKRRREHVGHVRVLTVDYLLHLGSPGLKVLRNQKHRVSDFHRALENTTYTQGKALGTEAVTEYFEMLGDPVLLQRETGPSSHSSVLWPEERSRHRVSDLNTQACAASFRWLPQREQPRQPEPARAHGCSEQLLTTF